MRSQDVTLLAIYSLLYRNGKRQVMRQHASELQALALHGSSGNLTGPVLKGQC